uniref:kelch-like protein 10 n=1 Tax=Myxine glutinosa TaxID=7769 RepID=UPI00358FF260
MQATSDKPHVAAVLQPFWQMTSALQEIPRHSRYSLDKCGYRKHFYPPKRMEDISDDNEYGTSPTPADIFYMLRIKGRLCDAILNVNGELINVHKNLLSCISDYFRVLFSKRWNGHVKREFNVIEVEAEVMHLLCNFSCTGFLPVTDHNVHDLLIAANYYGMASVLTLCCEFLKNQICFENCIGIYMFAQTYCCNDLVMIATKFILKNFVDVVCGSEEFAELPLDDLIKFIERDDLNVKNEAFVFEAVLKWIGHSVHERKENFVKLLPKVRLCLLDPSYFMSTVKSHEYVENSMECRQVIISAIQGIYNLTPTEMTTEMAHPRHPCSVLFAIGGWSGGSPTNVIACYDSRARIWVSITENMETPCAYHGTALFHGFIFIVGGFDGMEYFNTVRRFDPVGFIWNKVAPMHFRRCYVSIAVLNNYLYAIGGFDGFTRLNTAECYEHQTNQWTVIPSMQEQRSDASATALNGKIFICGGFNGIECLSSAECFTPETNQWTPIASMNSRRSGVGVIEYGGFVYAVGGFDGLNRLCTAEIYSEALDSWTMISNMFNPRSNFGLEVVDDFIVVAGGFNGYTTVTKAEGYDPKSKTWFQLADMAVNRSALSCCVADDLPNVYMYCAPGDFTQLPAEREEHLEASVSMI